jgi:hypothetical protein
MNQYKVEMARRFFHLAGIKDNTAGYYFTNRIEKHNFE